MAPLTVSTECPPRTAISLVGAGPGGADLITVRGARLIASADVLVYDRLVDPAVLEWAPPTTELIPVGKAKGRGTPQSEINSLLVRLARSGRRVVRLKGGDPFLFGRGTEEVDALHAAGVDVEVVPGLSSSLAGPALAGIAVTERDIAGSVAVVSGHRADETRTVEWRTLADAVDTIVVLMGATTAAVIANELLAGGLPPTHPVAAVHAAGQPGQSAQRLTLSELADRGCPYPAPCILVIGEVAARSRGTTASSATMGHGRHVTAAAVSRARAAGSLHNASVASVFRTVTGPAQSVIVIAHPADLAVVSGPSRPE